MSLGPPGAQLSPEQAENLEDIEKQFAVKVVQHMETYWSILERKRMQFYAIEIARNRAGLNDWISEQKQAEEKDKT